MNTVAEKTHTQVRLMETINYLAPCTSDNSPQMFEERYLRVETDSPFPVLDLIQLNVCGVSTTPGQYNVPTPNLGALVRAADGTVFWLENGLFELV